MYRPVPTVVFGERTHVAGLVVMIEDLLKVEATEEGCGSTERACGGSENGRECSA
jgi:hypothetical protein